MKILFLFILCFRIVIAQTTLTDLGRLATKTSTTPVTYQGSAVYQNYLYNAGDGKVFIYNAIDPVNPVYIKTIASLTGVKSVWIGEKYLFVYVQPRIKIYDLTDPLNPVFKSEYIAGTDLHQVSAKGNLMFVLYMMENVKAGSFEIIDITNPTNPQLKGTYKPANYEGRVFCFSETNNRVYVSHYRFDTRQGYIREIDYSVPTNPTQIRELIFSGGPTAMSIFGQTMFILKDSGWEGPSTIAAYNLSGTTITLLGSKQVSNGSAWDMHCYQYYITVTLLENSGVKHFKWNETTKTFDNELTLPVNYASQVSWFMVSSQQGNSYNSLRKNAGGFWIYIYYYIVEKVNDPMFASEVYGYYQRLVEIKIWIEVPDAHVNLITSVNPAEAASDGCTVTPAGTTQYIKNNTVILDANAGSGWVWDKWTGALSGNVKPQPLLMNADKNVIGNFQPILVLGFTSADSNNICPPEPNTELTVGTASIFVDGVDWQLNGITFTVVEKFKPDFTEAWIDYLGKKLKGSISTDGEGFATSLSFSPDQKIEEGTTLSVRLFLKFNFPSTSTERYIPNALTMVMKYKVSIHVGQVNCIPIPVSARPGVKTPIYPPTIFYSRTQMIASVWNVSKIPWVPFDIIQQAVYSNVTSDGNTIKLCPCLYKENVTVNKRLTISAFADYPTTIVEPKDKLEHVFRIEKNNTELEKITIRGADGLGATGVYADKGNEPKRLVKISGSLIEKNYKGILSNSVVDISSSIVRKNKNDGIECDTLVAYMLQADQNDGNGVYSYGNIYFDSETGKIASASYNKKNGLFSKSRILTKTSKGKFKFNGNNLSGIYCEGNLFEIRCDGVTADSNKEYGIYSKNNLKGNYLSTSYNGKDGLKGGYISCTQIFSENNEGDGVNGSPINLAGMFNYLISASYNKGWGMNSNSDVTIDADSGLVKINRNGMSGVKAKNVTEIINATRCTVDSNGVYGIDSPGTVRLRNSSVSYNQSDGIHGGYNTTSNLIVEHNKGNGITGGLMSFGTADGKIYSVSYNEGYGIKSSDWVIGLAEGATIKFNKNSISGIYARAGTEIYSDTPSSFDSNGVYGIDSPQNIRLRNASASYNGRGGMNGGYISSSNIIADHNKGDGIKCSLLYLYASENKIYSASHNDGNGIVTTDWTVGETEDGRLRFNRNGGSGIYSPIQSIEIYGDKPGVLTLDSNGVYGASAKNNLKIKNASASYNGKDGLFCGYITSMNIKADFNKGSGLGSDGLLHLGSYSGFRSSANDNGDCGIKSPEIVLSQVNTLRNKNDGVNGTYVEFIQGASNNNNGWGIQVNGLPAKSKIQTVNLTGNGLGAINYTGSSQNPKAMSKSTNSAPPLIINNCDITRNSGPGIVYNSNQEVSISQNNIYGNKDFGLQNLNSSPLDAANNWWGDPFGPTGSSADKIQGNVSYLNWKSKQISMLSSLSSDTLNLVVGKKDSVYYYLKQTGGALDKVNIAITGYTKLVEGNLNLSLPLESSGELTHLLRIASSPFSSITGKYNVILKASSNKDTTINSTNTLVVNVYAPLVKKLKITNTNPVVIVGNKLQFNAAVEDQFGKEFSVIANWEATGGTIDVNGLFTAGNQVGEFNVKAIYLNNETTTRIKIVSAQRELVKIVLYPDSIKINPGKVFQFYASGKDQLDSVFAFKQIWETTGGTIDSLGQFTAGSSLGQFIVKVKNESGTISAQAKVVVTDLSDIEEKNIPTTYSLSQNYPNPFNPETVIRYQLPAGSYVTLKVYDVLGKEIVTLVDEYKQPGIYNYNFSIINYQLSSGVYIYQIMAGNPSIGSGQSFIQARKMLLIK